MVRCVECGLLAVRDEYNDSICEATDLTRTKGSHQSSIGKLTNAKVFCYADSPTFPEVEFAPSTGHTVEAKASNPVVAALAAERDCELFRRWHPGKTPQVHEELTILERVQEENQRARNEDRQRVDEWRAEDVQARRESEAATARRFRRTECRSWIAVVVSIIAIIVAAAVALIKR